MIFEYTTTHELAFPDPQMSDNPDPEGRKEENLFIFGPRALDDFYRFPHAMLMEKFNLDTQMDQMMWVLPHLAKLFDVDKDALLQRWTSDFGMWHMATASE